MILNRWKCLDVA
uniref:Uncharacterized protein n=1 Tax=Arundo donax TaxID=35708 RepID=A0A0A9CDT6_ARUDO